MSDKAMSIFDFEQHPIGKALIALRQRCASDFTDPQHQGQRGCDWDAGLLAACSVVRKALSTPPVPHDQGLRDALEAMLAMYGPPATVAGMCDYPADHPISKARKALSTLPQKAATDEGEVKAFRSTLIAAARIWWTRNMPNSECRSAEVKGDGRVDVYWQDHEERGKYTLPVDFLSTPTSQPLAAETREALKEAYDFIRAGIRADQQPKRWVRITHMLSSCIEALTQPEPAAQQEGGSK
jgi:hypothetical protein